MKQSIKFSVALSVLFVLCNLITPKLFAQTPSNGIFFQAVARDKFSNPAKDRKIYVQSSIIQSTATGTKVLTEEYQTTTDLTGVFSISIGQGTKVGGTMNNLTSIDWSKGPYFLNLKIAISPVVPTDWWNYTKEWIDLGTTPFGTVPYALYAGTAAGVDQKVNISDTVRMLTPYAKVSAVKILETGLATKLTATDTSTMLANYAKTIQTIDTAYLKSQLATKLSLTDTATMLANYLAAVNALKEAKLNASDTVWLSSRINEKANTSDVNASLGLKANAAEVTTAIGLKANTSDVTTSLTTKVDKVIGKELSTNDYTTAEKTKLAAISGTNTGDQDLSSYATNLRVDQISTDVTSALALKAPIASPIFTGTVGGITKSMVGLGNVENTSDASKPISSAIQTALSLKANTDSANFTKDITVNGINVGIGGGKIISNTRIGQQSLFYNTTGGYNTAIGMYAIHSNKTGFDNTAIGYQSLYSNTFGYSNTALGLNTLLFNTIGAKNTASGNYALTNNTTGCYNTAIGINALIDNNTGNHNTAIGNKAGVASSSLENTTAIGDSAIVSASNTIQLGNINVINVKTSGTLTAGAVTYPKIDGANGQVLTTNGIGSVSWVSPTRISVGTISNTSSVNGATITSGVLNLTAANENYGGIVTSESQTIGGIKTFASLPLVPTATAGTNNTQIATTEYVQNALLSTASVSSLVGAVWNSATTGTLNGVGFTISLTSPVPNIGAPEVWITSQSTANYSTSYYSSAQLSSSQSAVIVPSGSSWQVVFEAPISNLKLYTYWRALGIGGSDIYQFDQPFSILTGSSGLTKTGNVLNISGWGQGILEFSSPITTLTLTADGIHCCSGHSLTFGVLPLPAAGYGEVLRSTSPTLVRPNLGTPASVVLTNATGLALTTGVTGRLPIANGGTGLSTAGTSGQVLSTTESGTLTWTTPNTTATAYSGILPIANGGTGSSTQNFVDLTTAQTIAGAKTFTSNLNINGVSVGPYNGISNTMVGNNAFLNSTPGVNNTAIGSNALSNAIGGNDNTAVGSNAIAGLGLATGSGWRNTAVGVSALANGGGGSDNVAVGFNTLPNTTGGANTAVGMYALLNNTTATENVAIGAYSQGSNTIGNGNTSIGTNSMALNTIGEVNTAVGQKSLYSNLSGRYNTAIGVQAQEENTTGGQNTAIGVAALDRNTTGAYNAVLGAFSGRYIADNTTYNTAIDNSVLIGALSRPLADNANNEIVIGYNAIGNGSNTVTLGNTSVTDVKTSGTLTAAGLVLKTANIDNSNASNYNVKGVGILFVNAESPYIDISGFSGGVIGQVIQLVNANSIGTPSYGFRLLHNDTGGNQKFANPNNRSVDIIFGGGGVTIVFDGTYWRPLSSSRF
jgi:hypothetical protein